jgi:hypothetical protein
MKRILGACLILSLALFTFGALALAAPPAAHHAAAAAAAKTISGEIVDLSCYLGHGAKGAAHKECAATCAANGSPMGLLTDKGVLYVLTMNHENPDAYNAAKKIAGGMAKVTGSVGMKSATRALQVDAVEAI